MSSLYLLVGAPCSGKSTWARDFCTLNQDVIYLNADLMRSVIGADESDQTKNGLVFETLFTITEYFMKLGKDILIDNCNYNRQNRREFILTARQFGAKVRVYIFNISYEVCVARNEARERKVPLHVIKRQFDKFELPTLDEVDEIFYV